MSLPDVEAVTVCINYGDFLGAVAPLNRHQFRQWVVVTCKEDCETREVCRQNKIRCVLTEDHERDGVFSKGRLVERGLQHLSADTWVAHIDSDISLPLSFQHDLEAAHLQTDTLYGADRFMVKNYAEWQRLRGMGWPANTERGWSHSVNVPAGFQIGTRWAGPDGYVPIGFFQLWHRDGGGEEWRGYRTKPYPSLHGTACRTDVQHGLQWDRKKRQLLPELLVAHLESGSGPTPGANWNGRTTPRFGPPGSHPPKKCS